MKKILLVLHTHLSIGGVQNVLMSIVRNLHREYQFDILCFSDKNGHYDEEFLSYGGTIHRIPYYSGNSRFRQRADFYIRGNYLYRETLKILRNNSYDVVHCHNGFEAGIICKAAKKAGVKVRLSHVHTSDNNRGNIVRRAYINYLENQIHKNATGIIACSQVSGKAWFPKTQDMKVIYNSYNDKKFDMDLYTHTEKSNNIKLVQIGRFSSDKNQEFSIRILAEILKKHPDAILTLVGGKGDGEEKRLKDIADNLGISKNINFVPATDKIPEILNEHNVFLFPSLKEGFGIAVIEAQAMGLSCFASDAVPIVTNCGGAKYLPLSKGPEFWSEKIIEDFERNGGERKKYDCSRFSEETVMKKYREIYEGN